MHVCKNKLLWLNAPGVGPYLAMISRQKIVEVYVKHHFVVYCPRVLRELCVRAREKPKMWNHRESARRKCANEPETSPRPKNLS